MTPGALLEMLDVVTSYDEADWSSFSARKALMKTLGLDEATVVARLGILQVRPLAFAGSGFDAAMRGVEPELGVMIAALDERERWLDLVAWPVDKPRRIATLAGRLALIGEHTLRSGGLLDPPLLVHRDVVAWTRAQFRGVVVVDAARAARVFLDNPAVSLAAEDRAHAAELAAARARLVDRAPPIVVPERRAA